jgi:two-component system cell cycle response regulator
MGRVLLIDDSSVVRSMFRQKLTERGYEVEEASDGVTGAQLALSQPPDIVVTDLWMPGISGVQLCRLLRSEPRTAHVPVILVTGESDRRSRFWARCAGAAAYVVKTDTAGFFNALEQLKKSTPTFPPEPPRDVAHGSIQERLSQRLDAALFESVVAGEVRSLARNEGDLERLFAGLSQLASEIAGYRWLGMLLTPAPPEARVIPAAPVPASRMLIHTHTSSREACEAEAREALAAPAGAVAHVIADDRPLLGRAPGPALVARISLGAVPLGMLALGPNPRGASREDTKLVELLGVELAGPLRIVALVEDSRRLAMMDPLTGLMNRRAFLEAMGRELAHAERHAAPLSLLLLDIDHFKRINDTRGHDGGDAVLRGLAEALRRIARKSDVLARWGGEEFVIGLPHTGEGGARIAAERVRRSIAGSSFAAAEGDAIKATASIGIAVAGAGEKLDALIARADQAMYAAKARGRNRVETGPVETPTNPAPAPGSSGVT